MKVYVASSWRNDWQPGVVYRLREDGHDVYDFRHPEPGNDGFAWSSIDPDWQRWSWEQYRKALRHPLAAEGFRLDMDALRGADATVLVMPCGRSAHLELGYAVGAGQHTAIILGDEQEPELMYLMADLVTGSPEQVCTFLRRRVGRSEGRAAAAAIEQTTPTERVRAFWAPFVHPETRYDAEPDDGHEHDYLAISPQSLGTFGPVATACLRCGWVKSWGEPARGA